MGQIELYEWMKKNNNGRYKSAKQIYKGMLKEGVAVENDLRTGRIYGWLFALERWGYLEARVGGKWYDWQRRYRIKKT